MEIEAAATYLQGVVDGLKKGELSGPGDSGAARFAPQGPIEIKTEMKSRRDREKVEISISWDKPAGG